MFPLLLDSLEETLFMMLSAGLLTFLLGLPIGILMAATRPKGMHPSPMLYKAINFTIELACSIPYLILMIALIPLMRHLLGPDKGALVTILSLSLAATPFFVQTTTKALLRVPRALIEMGISMGGKPLQILVKILLPEALPLIMQGFLRTLTHLLGFSVIAGALGAGGLGKLAIERGYYQFDLNYVVGITVVLILMLQAIQFCMRFFITEDIHGH